MTIVAVIPCYNEAKYISDIVIKASKYVDNVIIADDGSSDKTRYIAQQRGAEVISSEKRRGYGGNIRIGIDYALLRYNPDIVVILDGDGQHNPDEIVSLVRPIEMGESDIVVGNRAIKKQMPMYRRFGNAILNIIVNMGSGHRIYDSTCGFRAIRGELLNNIKLVENQFGIALELLIKARAAGLRITNVPIGCVYHSSFNDNSSMNPLPMGLSLVLVALKYRVKSELFRYGG